MHFRSVITLAFLSLILHSFAQQNEDLTVYVNPMVGTKNMGHTFPGAVVPFGMVQLSPETDTVAYELNGSYNPDVYKYCSGYQYDDSTIVGFSHTHFSGTGHSDLGDILIMPTTGEVKLNPGTASNPISGYRSSYNHETEVASPAFYSVVLEDYNIKAQLTASTRVGYHKYTFPRTDSANIILDLMSGIYNYDDKNVWTFLRIENDTLITGYRQTSGWARTKTVYFAISFSSPIRNYGHEKYDNSIYKGFWRKFDESNNYPEMAGRKIKAWFSFSTQKDEVIQIKVALSPTSASAALDNMKAEIPGWDFETTLSKSKALWNTELGKIKADFLNLKDKETFYTALYHSFLSPHIYNDVDGSYKGLDQNIHLANGFTNYTVFSLWDTYRALHPLFNLIQPSRNRDMIESMMAHYNQSVHKMLPIWSHYANENWCMIGYHGVSVIADAMVKGVIEKKNEYLQASAQTANNRYYDGISFYKEFGYVPEDKNSSSVSKTLEYAYDDWCIAQMAILLEDKKTEEEFTKRSLYFKNLYDSEIGFMRPKLSNGEWKANFNTLSTHGQGFIEGNAWNYGLYVPHQPELMIEMMGGKDRFSIHLDSLFTMQLSDEHINATEDITRDGIIGNYVHGNEPGHHIVYLYNYTDDHRKTQQRVRMILKTMYSNSEDGLCGNDDAGQMSAWYIFNSLGFYPMNPGSTKYELASPLVKSAVLNLENGNTFEIVAKNQSEKHVFVKEIVLNGENLDRTYLLHEEIVKGGKLVFNMSRK